MKLDPGMQQLVDVACRATAGYITHCVMARLEEHFDDPAERWAKLREALRNYARGGTRP